MAANRKHTEDEKAEEIPADPLYKLAKKVSLFLERVKPELGKTEAEMAERGKDLLAGLGLAILDAQPEQSHAIYVLPPRSTINRQFENTFAYKRAIGAQHIGYFLGFSLGNTLRRQITKALSLADESLKQTVFETSFLGVVDSGNDAFYFHFILGEIEYEGIIMDIREEPATRDAFLIPSLPDSRV